MHHQGGHSGPYRGGKVRGRQFLQVELDHHVLGDLAAFGGPILQPAKPVLHFRDAALEARGQGLIGQGGPDDGGQDFVQVGEALDRIGEGLLVDWGSSARRRSRMAR